MRGRGHLLTRPECLLALTVCSCVLILTRGVAISSPFQRVVENPEEQIEEKIKTFREKKDRFFKEDSRSPLKEAVRRKFRGLPYYPINLKYAIIGTIERYPTDPKPLYVNLPTNKGRERRYVKYGRFKFKWEGKEYVLQVYRPLGGGDLFLPFKDKTAGTETYPQGRYLHIELISEEKVLIDFNRAYNPFCEYNEKYTCPFALEENWLDIPIRAGEKRFH
jgi:uncharacterized protein (DUF1684 family)